MENPGRLILTRTDFEQITSLVQSSTSETTDFLAEELHRASIVSREELPPDVVSMHSKVVFKDLDNSKEMAVTLVYPHEADIELKKVSILAPLGTALIGLRVGQIINWPVPHQKEKSLKVMSVLYQPESSDLGDV